MRKNYQRKARKSNHKFEVVGGQELLVRVPLPMAEVWAEMQAQVEELAGQAGLQILRAILENEVSRRVGPPHRPNPSAGCVRWGKQPGYVVFAGQKVPLERPRVRTREGQEVELESYRQLQQDGKLQRAVREGVVAGLSTRNYRRAVESVVEGYGIEKSSVSRQFVAASSQSTAGAVRATIGRSEPGGADDRWHSLWWPGAGGGAGHRRKRGKARFRSVARGHGEHRSGQRAVGRSGGSRTGFATTVSGGDRRIESTARGGGTSFRRTSGGTTLPNS